MAGTARPWCVQFVSLVVFLFSSFFLLLFLPMLLFHCDGYDIFILIELFLIFPCTLYLIPFFFFYFAGASVEGVRQCGGQCHGTDVAIERREYPH